MFFLFRQLVPSQGNVEAWLGRFRGVACFIQERSFVSELFPQNDADNCLILCHSHTRSLSIQMVLMTAEPVIFFHAKERTSQTTRAADSLYFACTLILNLWLPLQDYFSVT